MCRAAHGCAGREGACTEISWPGIAMAVRMEVLRAGRLPGVLTKEADTCNNTSARQVRRITGCISKHIRQFCAPKTCKGISALTNTSPPTVCSCCFVVQ